jgi:acetyltransferase-like isoleucine patch superfamily enzyme
VRPGNRSGRLRRVADRLLRPTVERIVDARVADALAEHLAGAPHRDPLLEPLLFGDPARLHVHPTAVVNNALFNVSSGEVTVEAYAFFGHNVCLLTGSHDVRQRGLARQRAIPASGRDIVVRTGAWLASNVTVQGPCVVGEHAVVATGAVVVDDVPPLTVVGGVPARVLRRLEPRQSSSPDG